MADYSTTFAQRFRKLIRTVGIGIAGATTDADSSVPTITSGSGAPSASEPAGSLYIRTNGSLYQTTGSASWATTSAGADYGATGLLTDVVAESTSANGVAVDGLTIKDGSVREATIADPGNAGAIPVTKTGVCALTSAGAETRTLAIPAFLGQRLVLVCDTYVGDIVVTVAAACNVANNNTLTFGAVSEVIELVGVTVGGSLVWQVGWNDGVGLTTV